VAVDCRSAGQLSTLFCRSDYRIAGRKADIADLAPLELAVIGYSTGNPWGWREAADRRLREAATVGWSATATGEILAGNPFW